MMELQPEASGKTQSAMSYPAEFAPQQPPAELQPQEPEEDSSLPVDRKKLKEAMKLQFTPGTTMFDNPSSGAASTPSGSGIASWIQSSMNP